MTAAIMARPINQDTREMSRFARWLLQAVDRSGKTLKSLDEAGIVDESYLHKVLKSYKHQYRYYKRPSREKTELIGQFLGDVRGALTAAEYALQTPPEADVAEPDDALPPDAARIALAYTNAPDDLKRMFESAADYILDGERKLVGAA